MKTSTRKSVVAEGLYNVKFLIREKRRVRRRQVKTNWQRIQGFGNRNKKCFQKKKYNRLGNTHCPNIWLWSLQRNAFMATHKRHIISNCFFNLLSKVLISLSLKNDGRTHSHEQSRDLLSLSNLTFFCSLIFYLFAKFQVSSPNLIFFQLFFY